MSIRKPYPIPDWVKTAVFSGVRLAEQGVRRPPRLDSAALQGIRNFILPLFQEALGSAVHVTPLIEAMRCAVPDARIVGGGYGVALEVFRNHPGLNALEPVPDPSVDLRGAVKGLRKLVDGFGGEPYCVLLGNGNGNVRAAVAIAAMLSGNGVRAGFTVAPALAHLPLDHDPSQSVIANNLRIPALLGYDAPAMLEPRMYFTAEDYRAACELLGGEVSKARPLAIFVTQTSTGQRKGWRKERFVAAAQWLMSEPGCRIALVGAATESESIEALRAAIGGDALSLAGRTPVPVLSAVSAQADIALTLDTGILHLIRAVELPACAIAPAWSPIHEWLPLGNPRFRILKNLDLPEQPADYMIDEVSVDEVCGALSDLLRRYPPSVAGREARVRRGLVGDLALASEKQLLEGLHG